MSGSGPVRVASLKSRVSRSGISNMANGKGRLPDASFPPSSSNGRSLSDSLFIGRDSSPVESQTKAQQGWLVTTVKE